MTIQSTIVSALLLIATLKVVLNFWPPYAIIISQSKNGVSLALPFEIPALFIAVYIGKNLLPQSSHILWCGFLMIAVSYAHLFVVLWIFSRRMPPRTPTETKPLP